LLLHGLSQIGLIHDVVTVVDAGRFPSRRFHGYALRDSRPLQVPNRRSAEVLLVPLGIDLQALNHSTDGADDVLCFAVPIIPADIHVIKNHVNPLRILTRKHSLEGIYSSGNRGYLY
jgi:hypothetical protein